MGRVGQLDMGRVRNPCDEGRTVGGSSGGEGGLVSSRCSPIGIASDLGGSIRIPSTWCGAYGFKPTPEWHTRHGVHTSMPTRIDNSDSYI